ncbi:MAG TPA: 3'-5' exonuclease, partial [Alcanivorax sp.]|nr:3'-5' exonuclease [Alcanivorax sp.]HCO65084.1 3'-5' exonuclease [Alcanivorax sp.]
MNVLVFDIETVPDLEGGSRIYDLHGLSDKDTASALFNLRRQENGSEFLRLHLHRVVAISVVLRSAQGVKVWSLGDEDSTEKELIERFYDGIDRFTPQIVSWNGGGFDLPVLNYRALKHGVVARRFWETGNEDTSFRFNNYLSRFHQRHLDLMEQLAMFNGRANAPLDQIATLLGFPGKMGMSGAKVFDTFQAGDLKAIRDYCETDVLNTWLVFLRFQMLRGELDATGY